MRLGKDCVYPCCLWLSGLFRVRVLESFLDSATDWFCEIEYLLSLIYLPHVIIIITNNIGNEVLSQPLLKDLLKVFGWESVNNQINGVEKNIKTVEIQMYFESQLFLGLLLWGIVKDRISLEVDDTLWY